VLITAPQEVWNNIVTNSMIAGTNKISSGDKFIDSLEEALHEGADFHDLINKLR